MRRNGTLIIIAGGLAVKALLFAWVYLSAGVTPLALMSGHDGHEYLQFAEIIGTGTIGALPEDVIRHDPGLAILLALLWVLTGKSVSLPLWALIVQLSAWTAIAWLSAQLCRHTGKCHPAVIAMAALGYPAIMYYSLFNLTEPLFTALILGSILLAIKDRYAAAFILAGLSALVRSTGLLLVFSLLLTHPALPALLRNQKNIGLLTLYGGLGMLPWITSQVISHSLFSTNFSVYQPRFGLPFSGFRGLADAGLVRSVYILGAVFILIASAAMSLSAAWRARWASRDINLLTTFMVVFITFHLCLKTLYYIDRQVWTFDYQDRYLVPLWPLAALAWRRWINWPVTAAFIAGSAAISLWWMKNYLAATVG